MRVSDWSSDVWSSDLSPASVRQSFIDRYKPAVLMALFALYVMTLPWLGFDVGSAVFVAAALVMDGERRLWLIAPVSIGFALGATLLFGLLLPYPMTTLVLLRWEERRGGQGCGG